MMTKDLAMETPGVMLSAALVKARQVRIIDIPTSGGLIPDTFVLKIAKAEMKLIKQRRPENKLERSPRIRQKSGKRKAC
jgi:predicted metallo-beta-lactamase superfamily hydrolase